MMEEQDILDDMSGDHSGSNQVTSTTDDHSVHLPAYLSYLSLGFRVTTTVLTVLMAGWVIITIKITRRLHNIHNIFVAHLMVTDGICALTPLLLSGTMIVGYSIGVEDFIDCGVFRFLLFPTMGVHSSLLIISIDKVIAITFPLRYREIMKPRVVFGTITTIWVLAVVIFIRNLFNSNGFTKVAQFGICISKDRSLVYNLMLSIVPIFLACLLIVILNIYLTIKAYQIRKRMHEESRLSGGHSRDNDKLKALKKKEANIKKHLKPMITLLVVVLGSTSIGLLFPLLYIPVVFLKPPKVYEVVIRFVVAPNIGFISLLLHPLVYGLYFKQVREPMMRLLRGITRSCKSKSAAVAPLPQRRINWLNPN